MNLGIKYRGETSINELAELVAQEARKIGLSISFQRSKNNRILLKATQTLPWHHILFKALPQKFMFILEQSDEDTTITYDVKHFFWYGTVTVLLCTLTAILLCIGFERFGIDPELSSFKLTILKVASLFTSLPLIFVNFILIRAGHGRISQVFWEHVQTRIEDTGTFLEPVSAEINIRYFCKTVLYLAFLLTLVVYVVGADFKSALWQSQLPIFASVLGVYLLISLLILLMVLALMISKKGFSLRMVPLLPGLYSLFTMLILLAIQLPALGTVFHREDLKDVYMSFKKASIAIENSELSGSTDVEANNVSVHDRKMLLIGIRYARLWASFFVIGTLIILGLSIAFAVNTCNCSLRIWPRLFQIAEHKHQRTIQAVIAGKGFLWSFRFVFLSLWIFTTIILTVGMLTLLISLSYATFTSWRTIDPANPTGIIDGLIIVMAITFNKPHLSPLFISVGHMSWVVYCLIPWALLGLSFLTLYRQRSLKQKALVTNLVDSVSDHQFALKKLKELSARGRMECPNLSVTESVIPFSCSYSFGVFRKTHFVEVSSRCITMFDENEIEALFAHELSHFVRGHVLIHNLFIFWGRLGFVGNTFVTTMENTFGYELAADHTAIEKFDIEKRALISVLRRIRNTVAAEADVFLFTGPLAISGLNTHFRKLLFGEFYMIPIQKRLYLGIQLFLKQYTSSVETSYWHPAYQDRIDVLMNYRMA